jgi:divalent metal cation (Fe/Co/Zn/Cd) transporter
MELLRDSLPLKGGGLGWGSLAIAATILFSGLASAHTSLAPHAHPHPVSVQADLTFMLIAAAAIVAGILISRFLRRR